MDEGVMSVRDPQYAPQHRNPYRYPCGDNAEDCHCMAYKFLPLLCRLLLSLEVTMPPGVGFIFYLGRVLTDLSVHPCGFFGVT